MQHLPNSPLAFGLESVQPHFDLIYLRELIPQDRLAEFDASLKAPDSPVLGLSGGGSVDVVVGAVGGSSSVAIEAATPRV